MSTSDYTKICSLKSLPEKQGVRIVHEEEELALFRIGENVHVLSNICPHNHVAKIYEGEISDNSVACPIHGWTFDLATGKSTCGMSNIKSYEVEILDGEVLVKIPKRLWSIDEF